MKTKSKYLLALIPTLALAGCLGPNPYIDWELKTCGQSWSMEAQNAVGYDELGNAQLIDEADGSWPKAEICLTDAQAENIMDPDSTEYQALALQAQAACVAQAADLELGENTCADSLTDPVHVGDCMLEEGECEQSGGDEAGETGDGFTAPEDFVVCNGDTCTVDQALIDEVVYATSSDYAADGTYMVAHMSPTGLQDGWEFAGIVSGNLGDALGFQNGDVVTEVGGDAFDSWGAVLNAANAALYADEVRVVFFRNGRVQTRTFVRN